MNQPISSARRRSASREADIIIDSNDPRMVADRNSQRYGQLGYGIRNGHINREQASQILTLLDRATAQLASALPTLNDAGANASRVRALRQAAGAAHRDFDAAWPPSAPEARPTRRSAPTRSQRRIHTIHGLRRAVARLHEGSTMGASLSVLTRGMRPGDVVALTAHISVADMTRMARDAGATPAEAQEMVEGLGRNATTAFHEMVRDETVQGLDRATRRIRHLQRPAQRNALVHAMLMDPQVGRAVFQHLTGGDSAVEHLLDRYGTTPRPSDRRSIEREVREAVGEALSQAAGRVSDLREEVLNGNLGTPLDTQLYELAPGAVDRVSKRLHLARSQGRSMTRGNATGVSTLEAGVAGHIHELVDEERLTEGTILVATLAFGTFAGFATGGVAAGLVAGLLRTAMVGAGRYAADDARLSDTRGAATADLASEGDVERAEETRDTHLRASVAEAATEAILAGGMHQLEHGIGQALEHAPTTGIRHTLLDLAEGGSQVAHLAEPIGPMAVEHAVAHGSHQVASHEPPDHHEEEGARELEPAGTH